MTTILQKIKSNYSSFGTAEKRIADYIIKSSNVIKNLSISEMAKECNCGTATIVRFAHRLGFEGYQALKFGIVTEFNKASQIDRTINKYDDCYTIFKKRVADILFALQSTEVILDQENLNAAAKKIMSAERIVIFGLGNSAAIATDVAHKLLRLGLNAQACSDNHMQAIIASHLNRNCVAIGISHSGASKDIIEALKLSKIGSATTICVTNYAKSPIVEVSDIPLFTVSDETNHSILALSSRIATLSIFDAIYNYIVISTDSTSMNAIFNTEYSLQDKKIQYTNQTPKSR